MSGSPRDPKKAKDLLQQAETKISEGNLIGALMLLDEAIGLDQATAINDMHGTLRAAVHARLGNPGPESALHLYNQGTQLGDAGQYGAARDLYLQAIALDPRFLWPINNLAWILATAQDPDFLNGLQAREYALIACELSNWNYWPFISTMAAASARCGYFNGAIQLMSFAKQLAEPEFQEDLSRELAEYQQGKAHIDFADKVVAGEQPTMPEGSSVQ